MGWMQRDQSFTPTHLWLTFREVNYQKIRMNAQKTQISRKTTLAQSNLGWM